MQDKPAYTLPDHNGYPVKLVKNAGRGVSHGRPYSVGDFDALFVCLPTRQHFCLIPATALNSKGVLQDAESLGKQAIVCYLDTYVFTGKGRRPDLWTQKFCFDVKDPLLHDKVSKLLTEIRSGA